MKFLKNKKILEENDFFLLLPNLMEIVSWKPEFKISFDDILFVEDQKKKLFVFCFAIKSVSSCYCKLIIKLH